MVSCYVSEQNRLVKKDTLCEGAWIPLISPDETDLFALSEHYGIDPDVLRAALDPDERSRIESDEGYTMVLVNIPTVEAKSDKELYNTIPLSVILTKTAVITVCSEDTLVLQPFLEGRVKDFHTQMKSRFVLQILYRTASLYLYYLRQIDKKTDEVEGKLQRSTRNHELFELLKLEKSLLYFTTALRSNEAVLEKLFRNDLVKQYPDDADLLSDVIVENKQAIEMAAIHTGVLNGMMDAFGSVISNNLNFVMKVLSIVTIIMAIPTMIFSAFGMNLNFGSSFAGSTWGFLSVVAASVGLSALVAFLFVKMKMFK